ncbi:MAG: glycine cleavage system aminomethyltransferase GcvT [Phycisphaerae bacterium]|nr:glycine cleavage system aminomethyltransferase GcvT [Phycisphaerae bacterium]
MKRTALYDAHVQANAKLVEFAGWEMPLLYRGIVEEHLHTRNAASIFDVSHMGRIRFHGPDAVALLDRVCTRNIAKLAIGRCGYSHLCNAEGGILDDVIISRDADQLIMVCNASNRPKILAHLREHAVGRTVTIDDQTEQTCMLAIQGPATLALARAHLPIEFGDLKRYAFTSGEYMGMPYLVSRSGYTGEDGLELTLPASAGPLVWNYVTQPGDGSRPIVLPAGLGARDTLRLEAGMPLYGHELDESIDPISAACGWAVDLSRDFIGVERLRRIQAEGPARKLVGLSLEGRRIARQGSPVLDGDRPVGTVTSGTFGPTVGRSIAMAYVDAPVAIEGRPLTVDLRGERVPARVGPLAAYKRKE